MTPLEKEELLQRWIDESSSFVFFGGAGVSTESGIPDFRSKDGLYHQKYEYDPETILSHSFFFYKTEEFYRFYRDKMLILDKEPNRAHLFLAELEKKGKLKAVITQNIDGLHQKAGSKKVIELHGSIHRNYCMDCGEFFSAQAIKDSEGIVPHCPLCNGVIKPDVVLYGECLNEYDIVNAINAIQHADLFLVAGTSLSVYPANSFVHEYRGHRMVLVNRDPISSDQIQPDLFFQESVGELFGRLHV